MSDREQSVAERLGAGSIDTASKSDLKKVLIVDDDEIALEMLKTVLVSAGYEVETAPDGLKAWGRIALGGVRMVISDWQMPGMDGLELCRRIRSAGLADYVYVILVTGRDSDDDVVEGLSAGADDFITKPFNPAELNVRVRAGARVLALETRDVAIFAMAKLAESRDPETGHHLERVRAYCGTLARRLSGRTDLTESTDAEFVRTLELTSPLHDIGKIGIPDAILLKPDRLSDEEFNFMKTHTTIGANTLQAALDKYPNAKYLRMACDIARYHHERYNGSGYPEGLAGEEIPLAARIVAVADVYDAVSSKRVYKDACSHIMTRSLIMEETGKHFDPVVVEAFEASEKQFVGIKARLDQEG